MQIPGKDQDKQEAVRDLELRLASPEDGPFLQQLFATTRANELAFMSGGELQKKAFLALQFETQNRQFRLSYPQAENRVILWHGEPIGRLLVNEDDRELTLVDVSLLTDYRNRGLGTRLIRNLLSDAAAAGKPVRLHVLSISAALRLYERLGFSRIGADAAYLEMISAPTLPPAC